MDAQRPILLGTDTRASYGVSMGSLRPSDVFTPNRFPLGEHNVYVFRAVAERELRRAAARDEIPVVYGEYGVGKTTLVKKFFQAEERERRLVHVLTPAGLSFADVAKIVLERLGYRVHVSEQVGRSLAVEGSAELGLFSAVRAKLAPSMQSSKTTVTELVI
jgi:dTDP-4-dehydrorhamnose reductase